MCLITEGVAFLDIHTYAGDGTPEGSMQAILRPILLTVFSAYIHGETMSRGLVTAVSMQQALKPRETKTLPSMFVSVCRAERCLAALDVAMDTGMTVAGPIFVVLAIMLILMCMWAFYIAVFGAV